MGPIRGVKSQSGVVHELRAVRAPVLQLPLSKAQLARHLRYDSGQGALAALLCTFQYSGHDLWADGYRLIAGSSRARTICGVIQATLPAGKPAADLRFGFSAETTRSLDLQLEPLVVSSRS